MLQRIEPVREVALQLRSDFENGLVTDEEIIEAAVAQDNVIAISSIRLRSQLSEEEADKFHTVGIHLVRKGLVNPTEFPNGHCDYATTVLKSRVEAADVLEGNVARIIGGGCGEDRNALDPTSYYHNYHSFLDIGHTVLSVSTIVDITGDQFPEVTEPVYIGPLEHPWTYSPRIEMWEW